MNIQVKKFYDIELVGSSTDWREAFIRIAEENKLLKKQLAEQRAGETMFQEGVLELNRNILDEVNINNDAIEFAEWISGEGYVQYDGKERWIAPHNNNNVYSTKELYKQYLKSLK